MRPYRHHASGALLLPLLLLSPLLVLACGEEPGASERPGDDGVPRLEGGLSPGAAGAADAASRPADAAAHTDDGAAPTRVDAGMGSSDEADPASSDASSGVNGPEPSSSASALAQLDAYLAMPRERRPALPEQAFASVSLTQQDAEAAKQRLWDDFARQVRETRAAEVGATESSARSIKLEREDAALLLGAPRCGAAGRT